MTIQRAYLLLLPSLFLFLLLSPRCYTAETWKTPSADWTQQDLNRLLNDSPWALQVEATMDDPADVREETQAPLPGAAEAGMAGAGVQDGHPRWDGGIAKNRMGHLATIPVLVRWDSALIVQDALKRSQSGNGGVLLDHPKQNFVITVIGLLPAGRAAAPASLQGVSSSDPGAVITKSAEENLEWFMANSRLLIKGQASLQPQNVRIDPKTGDLHLFFNRSDELLSHKRDVTFVTRYGAMNVEARFHTKEMRVDGKPDL